MNNTDVKLYRILRKMRIDREEIDLNSNYATDFCFDDQEMNIFLFHLETSFGIDIKNNDVNKISTVNSTIELIEQIRLN